MTLDEAARLYRWSPAHDYHGSETQDGKTVALFGLGIWEADLRSLRSQILSLGVVENSHVDHHEGRWLRVDLYAR